MTSPRQRPGRPSPPQVSNEAALLGALTAFAKRPHPLSVSQGAPARSGQNPIKPVVRNHTVALKPPAAQPVQHGRISSPPSGSLGRPVRHDSGSEPIIKEKGSQGTVQTSTVLRSTSKPRVQIRPKPPALTTSIQKQSRAASSQDAGARHDIPDDDDDARLPLTSSLVQMFEKQGTRTASADLHTPLISPKATRKSLVLGQDDQTVSSQLKPRQSRSGSETVRPEQPLLPVDSEGDTLSPTLSFRSACDSFSPIKKRRQPPPLSKPASQPLRRPSEPQPDVLRSRPILSPSGNHDKAESMSHKTTQHSPYSQSTFAGSSASIQATYNSLHPRRTSRLHTDDSLANAIVASSLASSRTTSPYKIIPSPGSLRRSHHGLFTRTPSPHKWKPASTNTGGMKHTLRKESPMSAEDDLLEEDPYYKHKKKRHIRKHANKYHEGDRKRWRNVVTERERDRYEGVWAANRGLLLDASHLKPTAKQSLANKGRKGVAGSWMDDTGFVIPATGPIDPMPEATEEAKDKDCVHALVVRDIWSRSRLPVHVLEDVWNLVDRDEPRGVLTKAEFVVGMWLVDQRLKGRKLPVKVSDSVWDSVRFLKGLKIRPARVKR